jgi:hypothetical protein
VVDVVVVDQHHRRQRAGQVAEGPQPQAPPVEHVQGGLGAALLGRRPVLVVLVAHGGQQVRAAPAELADQPGVGEVEVALGIQPQRA